MRIASRPSTTPSRLEAKPGESFTTIGSLASVRARATARATALAVAPGCRTTSTSFIACTGLKKCRPTTRPGSRTAAAMAATERDDVLVASSAAAGAARSSSANRRRFTSSSSTTASITTSASRAARASSGVAWRRPRTRSRSAAVSLPRATAPSSSWWTRSRAWGRASARLSVRCTSSPASATAYAIPCPMVPAPITATGPALMRRARPLLGGRHPRDSCRRHPRRSRAARRSPRRCRRSRR